MHATDKFRSDLKEWEKRTREQGDTRRLEALRTLFFRQAAGIPEDTLAAIFLHFLSLYGSKGPRAGNGAVEWLAGMVSLLSLDYDDSPFTKEEWTDIRNLVTTESGEMDMDVLSYILGFVVDNGAL